MQDAVPNKEESNGSSDAQNSSKLDGQEPLGIEKIADLRHHRQVERSVVDSGGAKWRVTAR